MLRGALPIRKEKEKGRKNEGKAKAKDCISFRTLVFGLSEVWDSQKHELKESGEKGMGAGWSWEYIFKRKGGINFFNSICHPAVH